MWLSSTAQHAIRAVIFIADHAERRPVRVDEIAEALACPRNYLSKTLHALTRAGVLRSARGPTGGFQLADAPDQLAIKRIVAPFEPMGERRCLVGRPECGGRNPCAAHHRWAGVATGVSEFFSLTTVADLLTEGPIGRPRHSARSTSKSKAKPAATPTRGASSKRAPKSAPKLATKSTPKSSTKSAPKTTTKTAPQTTTKTAHRAPRSPA